MPQQPIFSRCLLTVLGLLGVVPIVGSRTSMSSYIYEMPLMISGERVLKELHVNEGDDSGRAAIRFSATYGLDADGAVVVKGYVQTDMDQKFGTVAGYGSPDSSPEGKDVFNLLKSAHEAYNQAAFLEAGSSFLEVMENPETVPDDKAMAKDGVARCLAGYPILEAAEVALSGHDCDAIPTAVHAVATHIRGQSFDRARYLRNTTMLWSMAKCYETQEDWKRVVNNIGMVINAGSTSGAWKEGEIRTEAVLLGAKAALIMGDLAAANKYLSMPLRTDPDSEVVQPFYKTLKTFSKGLDKARKGLGKSSKAKAIAMLEEEVTAAMGDLQELLPEPSDLLKIPVKSLLCLGKAGQGKIEDALMVCEDALELIQEQESSSESISRSHMDVLQGQAEALVMDNDFKGAVGGWCAALALYDSASSYFPQGERGRLEGKFREASMKEQNWERRRPHAQVLDLPETINEMTHERRCKFIGDQYKKMSLRWHPDKAKGNRERAVRKFRESGEAKDFLNQQWRCG